MLLEVVPESGQIDFGMHFGGVLTLAVTGLLARLAGILSDKKIAIFAPSTFDTDYMLIRGDAPNLMKAQKAFIDSGITVLMVTG